MRKDALQVDDRNTGPLASFPNKDGGYDYDGLSQYLQQVKSEVSRQDRRHRAARARYALRHGGAGHGPRARAGGQCGSRTSCSTSCSPTSRSAMRRCWPRRRHRRRRASTRMTRSTRMSMSNRARRMLQHQLRHRADAATEPDSDDRHPDASWCRSCWCTRPTSRWCRTPRPSRFRSRSPSSQPRTTVVVMLTKDELFVQGEPIDTVAEIQRHQRRHHRAAARGAASARCWWARRPREQDLAEREITVMGDKSLPYEVLKKVMRTCTDADYGRISLAVLQKDKPVPPGAVSRLVKRGDSDACSSVPVLPQLRAGLGARSRGAAPTAPLSWRRPAAVAAAGRDPAADSPATADRGAPRRCPSAWRA